MKNSSTVFSTFGEYFVLYDGLYSLVCNDEMTEKTADYIAGMIKYKPEKGDIPASSGKKIKYPGPQYNPGILCVNLPVSRELRLRAGII
ncbi:hypothetical protein [Dysgonomonas termitidis]